MPDRLSLHAPVLINTLGHCAGAIAFGILLYLLVLDWRRAASERSILPSIAAGLALLWNLGSLIGLAAGADGGATADIIIAASFSVLSLLPAVLLHISLQSRPRFLWITGYAISTIAVVLHAADLVTGAQRFHYAAILLITIGFAVLTAFAVGWEALRGPIHGGNKRLAPAMALFLFAISFAHFKSNHDVRGWSGEAALHHAGIPLALFVLLQDYRFLLLDAFVRFLVNGIFAASAVASLSPNQQVTIGLACNGVLATLANPLMDCVAPNGGVGKVTSKLLTLPQGGYGPFASQENDDHNPDRVKPRNMINIGIGTDNLFHSDGHRRYTASLEIANLTNVVAVYNFLSTFSGTHFLQPRTLVARVGFTF